MILAYKCQIIFLVNTFIETKNWAEMIDSISDLDLSSQTFKDLLIIIFYLSQSESKAVNQCNIHLSGSADLDILNSGRSGPQPSAPGSLHAEAAVAGSQEGGRAEEKFVRK